MSSSFNPTPSEAQILSQVMQRESGGNYQSVASVCNPTCATGAYQFKNTTWQWVTSQTGVGTQYATAGMAPPDVQDVNALWLLRFAGDNANASVAWGASSPSGGYPLASSSPNAVSSSTTEQPILDVSGDASSIPTPDLLSALTSGDMSFSQVGLDPTTGLIIIGAGVLGLVILLAS